VKSFRTNSHQVRGTFSLSFLGTPNESICTPSPKLFEPDEEQDIKNVLMVDAPPGDANSQKQSRHGHSTGISAFKKTQVLKELVSCFGYPDSLLFAIMNQILAPRKQGLNDLVTVIGPV
jgi:hypothetical protein